MLVQKHVGFVEIKCLQRRLQRRLQHHLQRRDQLQHLQVTVLMYNHQAIANTGKLRGIVSRAATILLI